VKNVGTIALRDLRSLFTSPVAYVTTAIFLFISGFFFWLSVRYYHALSEMVSQPQNPLMQMQGPQEVNITSNLIEPSLGTMSFLALLVLPLVTMRVFAEERRMGTYELLKSYPITDWELLFGKFLASLGFYAFMISLTLVHMWLAATMAPPETAVIITGYVGMLLTGMAFLSSGIFFSTLTNNQIIAAFLTWGFLLLVWIVGVLESFVQTSLGAVLNQISLFPHISSFSTGVINSHDVLYFVLWTVLFFFLTQLSLESQRWRGREA